jgi:hypothetical protein
MRPAPLLLLSSLLLGALAGCAAKSASTAPDDLAAAARELDVKATATTGIIRGVVVDDAIRPLGGAVVSLTAQGKPMTTNTTAVGAFGFAGLPEGTYFVKAHKLGFHDAQSSVDVKAGVDDAPLTKISLVADRSFVKPFFVAMSHKGFIECGTDVVALCSVPNHFCIPAQPPCIAYTPNVTNDQFSSYFNVDSPPDWLQCELIWDSTQALGNTLSVTTRVSTAQLNSDGFYIRGMNSSEGPSPLLVVDDYDRIHNTKNAGKDTLGNGTGLELDIFSGGNVATPIGSLVGVQLNQDYQVIAHLFYGYRPPPGYRFTSDGDPPVPA